MDKKQINSNLVDSYIRLQTYADLLEGLFHGFVDWKKDFNNDDFIYTITIDIKNTTDIIKETKNSKKVSFKDDISLELELCIIKLSTYVTLLQNCTYNQIQFDYSSSNDLLFTISLDIREIVKVLKKVNDEIDMDKEIE